MARDDDRDAIHAVGATDRANRGGVFHLAGDGFEANFNSVKKKIFTVHMRDLSLDEYPFRKLLNGLVESGFTGFTFAEIPESKEPVRLMKYYRALWLAYQNLL